MNKKQALLDAAEHKARKGGYSNFSFRELADEVGMKSASVHYHFPTKADMGAELAKRYTERFLDALGDAEETVASGDNPIAKYVDLFRTALVRDKKMCLCGLLGAENDGLPEKVQIETRSFFNKNINWLTDAYLAKGFGDNDAKHQAAKTLSLLEGAIMISKTLADHELFELVVCDLSK